MTSYLKASLTACVFVVFLVSGYGCDVLDENPKSGDTVGDALRLRGRSIEAPVEVPPDDDPPPDDDVPPSIASDSTDFFPLNLGNTWKYRYKSNGLTNSGRPDSASGIADWAVSERVELGDTIRYTIDVQYDGDYFVKVKDEQGVYQWEPPEHYTCASQFEISEISDSLLTSFNPNCTGFRLSGSYPSANNYWREIPVARYYEFPPDTVAITGGAYVSTIKLVRRKGIVSISASVRYNPWNAFKHTYELIE